MGGSQDFFWLEKLRKQVISGWWSCTGSEYFENVNENKTILGIHKFF